MICTCDASSSDRTIKLWNLEAVLGAEPSREGPTSLSSQAVVAAHDKDINAVAIAPNDSLVCSGSQVRCCYCNRSCLRNCAFLLIVEASRCSVAL